MLKNNLVSLPVRPDAYRSKLFFYLFLSSLGMFFAASLISYCVIRSRAFGTESPNAEVPPTVLNQGPIEYIPLELPLSFWVSTGLLLFVSVGLHLACSHVRRERQQKFRIWLSITSVAALGFVVLQYFGMHDVLQTHLSRGDGTTKSYGICFTLALVHALHVIGGIGFLGYVVHSAMAGRYDHEKHWTVDNCASYWHFLDVVWLAMLVTFVVAR